MILEKDLNLIKAMFGIGYVYLKWETLDPYKFPC